MTTFTQAANWNEVRQAGASKGVSLSTTAAFTFLPIGTEFISLIGQSYSTAVVARFLLCPWLTILKTTDALATETNLTNYSLVAQDGTSTAVVLNSFDTAANLNFLYIGAEQPFAGVNIDVTNTNGNASVLTVKYWKAGAPDAWSSISATDNTASAGATFAQDGTVTWTIPTDWKTVGLRSAGDTKLRLGVAEHQMYWTRWEVSAALDSTVSAPGMGTIPRGTAYCELPSAIPWEQGVKVGPGGSSSIVALTDAGTGLLIMNCATSGRFYT